MCYRATQLSKKQAYRDFYQAPAYHKLPIEEEIYFHANGFDHSKLLTIFTKGQQRYSTVMQWGLIPNWHKPYKEMLKFSFNTLNAKSETIFDLASFKDSILNKRCILPVEGFFEYKEVQKDKLPYFIHPKSHPFFNIACVYSHYKNPETRQWITTFSIITGKANELMADIHNTKFRQPILIANDQIDLWLNPSASTDEIILLMQPCQESNMSAYRVDRDLIKIGNSPVAILPIK